MSHHETLRSLALPTLAVGAALVVYTYQGFEVGRAREKYGIKVPATTGNPDFERVFRAHQNTLESLVVFIPAIYGSALFIEPRYATGVGALYVIGRLAYGIGYKARAEAREIGFGISFLASSLLLGSALFGAGRFVYHLRH